MAIPEASESQSKILALTLVVNIYTAMGVSRLHLMVKSTS